MAPKKIWLAAGFAVIALGFAYHVAAHPMDFRVYHFGARGVFDGTRPVYGPASGLGWPMHYRYPPLFVLLFAPFAWLPLSISSATWFLLKCTVLAFLVAAVYDRRFFQEPAVIDRRYKEIIPLLIAAPYVLQDLRYGNAQFFVFALTAFALLFSKEKPMLAASSLALGIAIKVWPLFFIPYLLVRREWKFVTAALAIT